MRISGAGRLILLLFALWLAVPGVTEAGPFSPIVEFAFPLSYPDLEFGQGPGLARIQTGGFEGNLDDQLRGPTGTFQIVAGEIQLISGPLIDITPAFGDAVYTYAAGGSVSIDFDLKLPNASIHHGSFTAPLGEFVIGPGSTTGDLGPGLFDPSTASLLGIKRHTLYSPGAASLYLDMYDAYPQAFREAQAFGYMPLAVEVSEPAVGLLLCVGGLAAIRRRIRFRG